MLGGEKCGVGLLEKCWMCAQWSLSESLLRVSTPCEHILMRTGLLTCPCFFKAVGVTHFLGVRIKLEPIGGFIH